MASITGSMPVEADSLIPQTRGLRKGSWGRWALVLFLTGVGGVFAKTVLHPALAKATPEILSSNGIQLSVDECDDCTFAECYRAQCDIFLSPYVCTKGPSLWGCSGESTAWIGGNCEACCSMTNCGETIQAGGDIEGASCESCTEKECNTLGEQRCGSTSPYVCLDGSARFGCAADKFSWAAAPDTMCSSCCDSSSC